MTVGKALQLELQVCILKCSSSFKFWVSESISKKFFFLPNNVEVFLLEMFPTLA